MLSNSKNYIDPIILAIDTSCDETSVAILSGRRVLANVVSSQTELHKKWGGVVPDVARRAHIENLPKAFDEALKKAQAKVEQIDLVAVTQGPGLAIDLEVGIQFAQNFAIKNQKAFLPVNHMEGHLLSALALNRNGQGKYPDLKVETSGDNLEKYPEALEKRAFGESELHLNQLLPALGLLVSGKHTEIIYFTKYGEYKKIGKTLDDAAGEAFDKFGRMLGFGYPGGPIVSQFAKKGKFREDLKLPIPMEKSSDLNFSYSGLKTAALYKIEKLRVSGAKDSEWAADLCYAFIHSIADSITLKLKKSYKEYSDVKSVFAGGGVYKSEFISRVIGSEVRKLGLNYLLPESKYRSDNAVMIGIAALINYRLDKEIYSESEINQVDRVPRLSL